MLMLEDCTQCIIMIQPVLYAYSFNGPPEVRAEPMHPIPPTSYTLT